MTQIDEALEALDLINTTHFDTSCEDCNKIRSVLNKMRGA